MVTNSYGLQPAVQLNAFDVTPINELVREHGFSIQPASFSLNIKCCDSTIFIGPY